MTIASGARNFTATIDVLDATGATTATVTVSNELLSLTLSTNLFNTAGPDGRISWSGTAEFVAVTTTAISLDSRNTTGSPSGAQIWARGNRLNLSIADSGGTLRAFPCKLYLNSIPNPPNPPNNTISVSLADLLEADNFPQIQGDKSGVSEGTSTDRKTIINSILTDIGLPAVAAGDTLTVYPLTRGTQKTDQTAWVNYCGALAGSAGYTLWIDNTNTRLTPVNLAQSSPAFTVTIGEDDAEFVFTNRDERPPETLEVLGNGYSTQTNIYPLVSETYQYIAAGALLNTGNTDPVVGRYERVTENLAGNTLTIDTLLRVPKIVIDPDITIDKTGLTTAAEITETRRYSASTGQLSTITITERWARGWINRSVNSEEFTTALRNVIPYRETKITCTYQASTQLLTDRKTVVDAIRASLGGGLTPSTTEERTGEIVEKWAKKGKDQWRYDRLESRTAQELYNGDVGNMSPYALVPDERRSQSFQTNTGEANPPQTERKPSDQNSELIQYRGTAQFTPIAGTKAKQAKTDTINVSGPFCVSDQQCSDLAVLFGKLRHGRSLAAQYTGAIPDWLLTSYSPMPRVDVTLNGVTTAYLADGLSIAIDGTESAFSCYLAELGTVGADTAVVAPRFTSAADIISPIVISPVIGDVVTLAGTPIVSTILITPSIGIAGTVTTAATLGAMGVATNVNARGVITSNANLGAIGVSAAVGANAVTSAITLGPIGVAASVSEPNVDPNFANVELLLHCDGTNGSTTFTDSSSPAKTVTAFGNAQISTTTPKFGTGKGLFDGNGDYLEVPASADFEFGTGLFTVDLWINTTQGTGFHQPIGQFFASPLDGEWSLRPRNQGGSGGGIGVAYRTASGFIDANSGFNVNDGNWHFIRLVRESTTVLRLYVDGTMRVNHTISASQTLGRTGRGLRLGRNENDANAWYNGSIDDVRITKGVARPGSEVPTAAFPDS